MKKKKFLLISIFLFFYINACTGYKPIYSSSNFNFLIEKHTTKGNKRLSNLIYSKLYNASSTNKNNPAIQSISLLIETNKKKKATIKNNAGKILEYEINLNTNIVIHDFLTEKKMLDRNFNYSITYKVQDEHFETIKLENKNIQNLIDKTYQDMLIEISDMANLQ